MEEDTPMDPPLTKEERNNQIEVGVKDVYKIFVGNQRRNVYEPFHHTLQARKEFTMLQLRHYFSTHPARDEEAKSEDEVGAHEGTLVAVLFDPLEHVPSKKPLAECRVGLVDFAYFFGHSVNKNTGEPKVAVHPVAFKTMDRAQLQAQHEDTERERAVMRRLRAEGFRKKRADPLSSDAPRRFTHAYEHFPQWCFYEDAQNQYMVTDFAANGSLVQYTSKRLRDYSVETTHLTAESGLLDTVVGHRVIKNLWREEALSIFSGIVRAVSFMHSRGVCHLDLSPENVVIDALSNPILVDFGSSEVEDSSGLVGRGRPILCKLHFRPPEMNAHRRNLAQSPGVNGRAADMYSLGVILYWLLFIHPNQGQKAVDPVRCDTNWLTNLVSHVQTPAASHDQGDCGICKSSVPLPADVYKLFQGLLIRDPDERISAASLFEEIGPLHVQIQGKLSERSLAVFERSQNN
ncbi:hypothetical protein Poli38472_008705 [Pythium oligandrum]|uniref:non-specific serine/threonine protein kinase n=1 Tax=Pythium oligandrum TaxID=41045 RepID=A0A8K1FDY0_PYTOL|nr:hypothetical protein Poli38472_008705 [Pythium oligandrum]|eukprot:TMW56057.1 hypothetical protein Poli38472_008705 [Pythium oligandrum]